MDGTLGMGHPSQVWAADKALCQPGCCLLSFWYRAVGREQSSVEQAGTVPPADWFPPRSQGLEISGIYCS